MFHIIVNLILQFLLLLRNFFIVITNLLVDHVQPGVQRVVDPDVLVLVHHHYPAARFDVPAVQCDVTLAARRLLVHADRFAHQLLCANSIL